MKYLGFDIGGTKLRGYLVEPIFHDEKISQVNLIESVFPETEIFVKSFKTSSNLNHAIYYSIKRFGTKEDIVVSGSIAGIIDQVNLEAKCANIPFKIEFFKFLQGKGYDCYMYNDLFAAGTALARLGSGKNYSRVSILNAGTGNNIACALKGEVYTVGTEAGHTQYLDSGIFCGCGGCGHLESYASGSGAATMALTYFKNHPNDKTHPILESTLNDYNLENKNHYTLKSIEKNEDFYRELLFFMQGKNVMNAYRIAPLENPQRDIRRHVRNALAKQLGDITSNYRPELIIMRGSFVTENWDTLGSPSIKRFHENYSRFVHPSIPMPKVIKKSVKKDGVKGTVLCAIDEINEKN